MAVFAVVLLLIPTSLFPSKEAYFVSKWNEVYVEVDYMFSAMTAQADDAIIKSMKNAKTEQDREKYMQLLVKPYLRLKDAEKLLKRYHVSYMDGTKVKPTDYYYFDNIYTSSDDMIVGIKNIQNETPDSGAFMMMFDMNGSKSPNTWGCDIYGVKIYTDGRIKALGYDMPLDVVKNDCSKTGTGVFCSHYYRIGGEFNEG